MNDSNTKAVCTTAVWIATAVIFVFGVFRFNWNGGGLRYTLGGCCSGFGFRSNLSYESDLEVGAPLKWAFLMKNRGLTSH